MKDPQDPGDSGLEPASNESVSGSPASSTEPASTPQVSLIGPDSPRRLDVDPDSPMAVVVSLAQLSTGVRLAEVLNGLDAEDVRLRDAVLAIIDG